MNFVIELKDKRISYVKNFLESKLYDFVDYNFENFKNLKGTTVFVLSPAHKWQEDEVKNLLDNAIVFAGNIQNEFEEILKQKNIFYNNMMKNEGFVLDNAKLTAECFLSDLITNTSKSIFEQKVLILGSGRVSSSLAFLFDKLGVKYFFTVRSEESLKKCNISSKNFFVGNSYRENIKNFDVLINTIPAKLFDENDKKYFNKNQKVFELASIRCLNEEEFKDVEYIFCPALPSKYTPESAGNLIANLLKDFLLTKGEN